MSGIRQIQTDLKRKGRQSVLDTDMMTKVVYNDKIELPLPRAGENQIDSIVEICCRTENKRMNI
jgi:hypothetical protein